MSADKITGLIHHTFATALIVGTFTQYVVRARVSVMWPKTLFTSLAMIRTGWLTSSLTSSKGLNQFSTISKWIPRNLLRYTVCPCTADYEPQFSYILFLFPPAYARRPAKTMTRNIVCWSERWVNAVVPKCPKKKLHLEKMVSHDVISIFYSSFKIILE